MAYGMDQNILYPMSEEAVLKEAKIQTLRRIFQRADRVLIGEKVDVAVAHGGPAPAWSDGQTITLNAEEITDTDLAALIQIHGLNYHEVCHILYTPRQGSELTKWVLDHRFFPAFNMLEDQRIETLLVGRFPSVAPFLSATILRWLADSPQKIQSNYILVRGRRYLPLEVRVAFRKAFRDQHLIDTACKIIDEYRTLVFPRDYEKAKVLIEAFTKDVLRQLGDNPNPPCQGSKGTTGGRPQPQGEQEKDSRKAKQQAAASEDEADHEDDETPDADSDDEGKGAKGDEESTEDTEDAGAGTESDEDEDGDEDGEGAGESESDEEGDEDGAGDGESDESDGEGDEDGSGTGDGAGESESDEAGKQGGKPGKSGQSGAGVEDTDGDEDGDDLGGGNGAGGSHAPKSVEEILKDALNDIESDKDVVAEMEGKQRAINKGDGEYLSKVPEGQFSEGTIDGATKASQRKFQEVLRGLVEDCEPGWERETPSGRLNVGRVMQGCELDEAFDRWAEGNEGSDVEVVALYDNSGSMRDREGHENATKCAYVIQKSVKAIGGDCTSLVFGAGVATLYKNDSKVSNTVLRHTGAYGGTYAHPALEEAERILRASRRKNRLLIIVTDGEWEYTEDCNRILRRIEETGAHTALAFTDTNSGSYGRNATTPAEAEEKYRHGCQVFGAISNPADLTKWGKAVVAHAIKRSGAAR